ncbi:hypothetical protein CEXT_125931 [Caerostris extrusa]|uniref:Uncharacterized protein n=1 Tax=Caerostris extrusa TaxID=172846 RepID=A0AAV4X5Y3_CAEEX|nr:hypothetical protein CEXT_125931 [Caerostris extrusa]
MQFEPHPLKVRRTLHPKNRFSSNKEDEIVWGDESEEGESGEGQGSTVKGCPPPPGSLMLSRTDHTGCQSHLVANIASPSPLSLVASWYLQTIGIC